MEDFTKQYPTTHMNAKNQEETANLKLQPNSGPRVTIKDKSVPKNVNGTSSRTNKNRTESKKSKKEVDASGWETYVSQTDVSLPDTNEPIPRDEMGFPANDLQQNILPVGVITRNILKSANLITSPMIDNKDWANVGSKQNEIDEYTARTKSTSTTGVNCNKGKNINILYRIRSSNLTTGGFKLLLNFYYS